MMLFVVDRGLTNSYTFSSVFTNKMIIKQCQTHIGMLGRNYITALACVAQETWIFKKAQENKFDVAEM